MLQDKFKSIKYPKSFPDRISFYALRNNHFVCVYSKDFRIEYVTVEPTVPHRLPVSIQCLLFIYQSY